MANSLLACNRYKQCLVEHTFHFSSTRNKLRVQIMFLHLSLCRAVSAERRRYSRWKSQYPRFSLESQTDCIRPRSEKELTGHELIWSSESKKGEVFVHRMGQKWTRCSRRSCLTSGHKWFYRLSEPSLAFLLAWDGRAETLIPETMALSFCETYSSSKDGWICCWQVITTSDDV